MGETFGRRSVDTAGRSIQVSADGKPEMKSAGVTIDWLTVTAITGSDVTWLDGVIVKVGEKALRYGQVLVPITASGLYGPYDPAAADGRQLAPARDTTFVVNESIREDEMESNHPPVLDGGKCFRDRIIQSGAGAASLAAGPTLANLQAALPRLKLVTE
jgi:hypothetical protein